jgi:hypothetical protein
MSQKNRKLASNLVKWALCDFGDFKNSTFPTLIFTGIRDLDPNPATKPATKFFKNALPSSSDELQ